MRPCLTQLTIERNTLVHRRPPVLATEVAGEATMMDMESGVFFGLDSIGTDMWRRLEQPMSLASLADAMSRKYAADPATIERDLSALLLTMAEHGLVEFR